MRIRKEVVKQKGLGKFRQDKNKLCMKCNNYVRSFRSYNDLFLCYKCYSKKVQIIRGDAKPKVSLKKALEKTYEIKGYLHKGGFIRTRCHFPQILIGHKVKLVLLE